MPGRFTYVGEELKQTYTVRIPAEIAAHIEAAARENRITPTALIQSLLIRKFKSHDAGDGETDIIAETAIAAKLETLRKSVERFEQSETTRLDRLCFEIVKTRSALLHSLDQTLSAEVVDKIIEASEQTAREYMVSMSGWTETRL